METTSGSFQGFDSSQTTEAGLLRNTVNLSILCLGEYVFEQPESVGSGQEKQFAGREGTGIEDS